MLGNGDRAWKYYHQLIPKVAMATAGPWRYKAEPYVYASNFFGPESDKFGLANVSWLTGTASWMYVAATQYILGVRPVWEGLLIDPCLPTDWEAASVTRIFRGVAYNISISKLKGISKGNLTITVDGKAIEGNIVPFVEGSKNVTVHVKIY
jgi:cellobiose phosphorylase